MKTKALKAIKHVKTLSDCWKIPQGRHKLIHKRPKWQICHARIRSFSSIFNAGASKQSQKGNQDGLHAKVYRMAQITILNLPCRRQEGKSMKKKQVLESKTCIFLTEIHYNRENSLIKHKKTHLNGLRCLKQKTMNKVVKIKNAWIA